MYKIYEHKKLIIGATTKKEAEELYNALLEVRR